MFDRKPLGQQTEDDLTGGTYETQVFNMYAKLRGFHLTSGNTALAIHGMRSEDAEKGSTLSDGAATGKMFDDFEYLENNMPTIGDLTVAFWMRTTKNTSAQGLFSIPNSIKFWGNFDIFLENNNSETQAFFKVHIFNQTAKENDERWVEAKIDDIFGSEWVHLAFVYDGNTSTITVYRNGEGVFTKELPDCGKLKFNNVGASLAVGAFQFSTTPSLTSGAGAQTWAKNFPGQLDQFRLYDKVLTATEIQSIYSGKE